MQSSGGAFAASALLMNQQHLNAYVPSNQNYLGEIQEYEVLQQ